ncbi:hypothetical protein [Xenorhabdus bovienii]|uniref:hypothetical protein n=1 Tax=Xenorhabdus bovienii TaxID=40576 RepID=UPI0023B2FBCA|nr:hypothetical protein [Xenorhabdus bovienii]MDE9455421.1 hypothetical protein [Xenorhabdus bovienii]
MTNKHVHADLMMECAKLAQETDRPETYFQYRYRPEHNLYDDKWREIPCVSFLWCSQYEYRLKPRTIRIGNIDVPEPVRVVLESEQEYYYPTILSDDGLYGNGIWWGDAYDVVKLNRGLIHLDRESAEIHAKALISLTAK